MACSTCHVILDQDSYDSLSPPEEEEQDMIDLAWGCCDTSRLGCQIVLRREDNGMLFHIPEQAVNLH
jgi:cytochrome c oxidase assembly protein subunit 15